MWRLANHFLNQEKDYFYTFKFQVYFQTGKLRSMFTKMHYNQTFKTQEKDNLERNNRIFSKAWDCQ